MPARMITLLLLHASLFAAPILFIGLDGSGTGYTNGLDAQNRFISHLRGARTELFSGDICNSAQESCNMNFGAFSGVITGLFLRPHNAIFPFSGGAQSVPSVSAEGQWAMGFSTGVSAVGFYFVDAYLDDLFLLASPTYVHLRIGNNPDLLIDPAQYGIALRSRYSGFIGFVDPDTAYNGIGMNLGVNASFDTSLVTAATPDQIVPEPSSAACLVAGLAIIAAWTRERSNRTHCLGLGPKVT